MDLVSTPERSLEGTGRSGQLCTQPSNVHTADAAVRQAATTRRQARLAQFESRFSRFVIVVPALHDLVGLASTRTNNPPVCSSPRCRFPVWPVLCVNPAS